MSRNDGYRSANRDRTIVEDGHTYRFSTNFGTSFDAHLGKPHMRNWVIRELNSRDAHAALVERGLGRISSEAFMQNGEPYKGAFAFFEREDLRGVAMATMNRITETVPEDYSIIPSGTREARRLTYEEVLAHTDEALGYVAIAKGIDLPIPPSPVGK